MVKFIVIKFLEKLIDQLSFEEECLERHQDVTHEADKKWQHTRKVKDSTKQVIEYIQLSGEFYK